MLIGKLGLGTFLKVPEGDQQIYLRRHKELPPSEKRELVRLVISWG